MGDIHENCRQFYQKKWSRIEYGFLASNLEKGLKKEIVFVKYIKRFEVQKDTGISTLAFSSHPLLTKS